MSAMLDTRCWFFASYTDRKNTANVAHKTLQEMCIFELATTAIKEVSGIDRSQVTDNFAIVIAKPTTKSGIYPSLSNQESHLESQKSLSRYLCNHSMDVAKTKRSEQASKESE